ncbi:hypothetical protein HDK64DRAFT_322278 [Phyllosticta capitalensis]
MTIVPSVPVADPCPQGPTRQGCLNEHHVENPPTVFRNSWPSFARQSKGFASTLRMRLLPSQERNYVPVLAEGSPDWGHGKSGIIAKWIGHASWLVEVGSGVTGEQRGIAILLDPVFSDRMRGNGRVRLLRALGVKSSLLGMGVGDEHVTELDWWQGVEVNVGEARTRLVCTPSQHFSERSICDAGCGLWCSWAVEELPNHQEKAPGKDMFFARSDTGYRSVPQDTVNVADLPRCPAFKDIGELYGPFNLALLPTSCFLPRTMIKRSVGMHHGTVRGMVSGAFEDVRDPPQLWKEAAEKAVLTWGGEIPICGVGETVVV